MLAFMAWAGLGWGWNERGPASSCRHPVLLTLAAQTRQLLRVRGARGCEDGAIPVFVPAPRARRRRAASSEELGDPAAAAAAARRMNSMEVGQLAPAVSRGGLSWRSPAGQRPRRLPCHRSPRTFADKALCFPYNNPLTWLAIISRDPNICELPPGLNEILLPPADARCRRRLPHIRSFRDCKSHRARP